MRSPDAAKRNPGPLYPRRACPRISLRCIRATQGGGRTEELPLLLALALACGAAAGHQAEREAADGEDRDQPLDADGADDLQAGGDQ